MYPVTMQILLTITAREHVPSPSLCPPLPPPPITHSSLPHCLSVSLFLYRPPVAILAPESRHSRFSDPVLVPFSKFSNPLMPGRHKREHKRAQESRERIRSDWREGRESCDRLFTEVGERGWTDITGWIALAATRI